MKIIDGKILAEKIENQIKEKIKNFSVKPGIAVILLGDNPESRIYVENKERAFLNAGFNFWRYDFEKEITFDFLREVINKLNKNPEVHGIIIQLPLPESFKEEEVISLISPEKDVDCLSPVNLGKLLRLKNLKTFPLSELPFKEWSLLPLVPATPKGIITLIKSTGLSIEGKNAVIVGRSNLVGKPLGLLLLAENATVTICHSKTVNLAAITKEADILVVAVGKPNFITTEMVKEGAVVIDVGINRTEKGLVGDVDFENVKKRAGFITPVPGGVGPVTIASLMENTLIAYLKKTKLI